MRLRRLGIAVLSAMVLAAGSASSGVAVASPDPAGDYAEVRQAMDELIADGAAGVLVRVRDGQQVWTHSAGVAEVGRPDPVPLDGRFRIGSITKTFVATVVLQLVDEGRVGLEDSVAAFLPQYGLDPRITVRMILQHTSGLFNYTGEFGPDGVEPGILPITGPEALEAVNHPFHPDELVQFALSKPARFAPGTNWSYSNTNYILAGLLIEKLTGLPYAVQIYTRIVVPLGLWSTFVPGTFRKIPGPHAHGYADYLGTGDPKSADVTELPVTWAGAAGEIVSSAADLDTFLAALLEGRLLPPPLLAEMRTPHSFASQGATYGLGLLYRDVAPGCTSVGHDGGVPGYTTELAGTDDGRRTVVVSVTSGPTLSPENLEAAAEWDAAVSKIIVEIVGAALCDTTTTR
ncbi:serine hydrolase [Nocardia sp. CNY236]|uniref:serine hydrolase domain-containing protein n=1 Tax=Nocardia sp. CNY236 TaxID=1169152 RepID=UPI0018C9D3EF|nr:serine hydrolase domain-containing protein [Nocardia sp. CNY236]